MNTDPKRIRTAHLGLGPIGIAILTRALDRPSCEVVAAIDLREDLIGRDVADLVGRGSSGVTIVPSLDALTVRPEVVIQCTGSRLQGPVVDQILAALRLGASVVSTCEELSYPWQRNAAAAQLIDDAAREAGCTVLATGVNPGFAMDSVVLAASAVLDDIDSISVHRVVDVGQRRVQLQHKVGVGISETDFADRRGAGQIGHVGLLESAALVDRAFGLGIDEFRETIDPVLAAAHGGSRAARVLGIKQTVDGTREGVRRLRFDLEMWSGAPEPGDILILSGAAPLELTIKGIRGDSATAAIVINALHAIGQLPAGLATMLDLVPARMYPSH